MNIYSAIKKGSNILSNNLIKSAKLDSEILMAKVIDRDRSYILLNSNDTIDRKNLVLF